MLRNKINSDLTLEKASLLLTVDGFVSYVLDRAVIFEPFHVAATAKPPVEYGNQKSSTNNGSLNNSCSKTEQNAKSQIKKEILPTTSTKRLLLCLNPVHRATSIRHWIQESDITSEADAQRLIIEAKKSAQERRIKNEKQFEKDDSSTHDNQRT